MVERRNKFLRNVSSRLVRFDFVQVLTDIVLFASYRAKIFVVLSSVKHCKVYLSLSEASISRDVTLARIKDLF